VAYEQTREFAHQLARDFEEKYPALCLAGMDKSLRGGKVFIDWSQNADFKTTIGVYSLRAKTDQPFVSAPVTWRELKTAMATRNREALFFSPLQAAERAEKLGDLFEPVLSLKQKLPAAVKAARSRVSIAAAE
jgi:bifunctional non-homologous end joining protein LigD